MTDSLKDQLMKLGFKPAPKPVTERKPERKPERRQEHGRPSGEARGAPARRPEGRGRPRHEGDIDLGKAFAIRAQKEKDERIAAERQRQEDARQRREARAKLDEFLRRVRLNDDTAEIARHFPYGGKIRRIHVTADQLAALNAGTLAVVQLAGRYHLVTAADGAQAEAILADSLALQVDPNAPPSEEDYADPRYQVPDDLVW
ncbi:MAG TPA: DUF2058 family protein [Chiayiivirga sp.]|nr:DUF2058 family protein [Chiayiivirga sp.]